MRAPLCDGTDNGEPGSNDTFQLELDNGALLLSGSVELLIGNLSSTAPPGFKCRAP